MNLMQCFKKGEISHFISFELIILHETLTTKKNEIKSAVNYLHNFKDISINFLNAFSGSMPKMGTKCLKRFHSFNYHNYEYNTTL